MSRKFIFYFKNSDRGIVLTEKSISGTIEEVSAKFGETLSGNFVSSLETENDVLIFKSSEVFAIHIVKENDDDSSKIISTDTPALSKSEIMKDLPSNINLDEFEDDEESFEDELDVEQALKEIDEVIEDEDFIEGEDKTDGNSDNISNISDDTTNNS